MRVTYFLLITCITLFWAWPTSYSKLYAQKRCVSYEYNNHLLQKKNIDPQKHQQQFERFIAQKLIERKSRITTLRTNGDPMVIPVVVHVIHNGEPYGTGVNISDEQILSQIKTLNEDYNRLNDDASETDPDFVSVAGKIDVEFVLAYRDPEGNPSNGIVRKQGPQEYYHHSNDNTLLKSQSFWRSDQYLNIWVTKLSGSFIGYAQYPDINLPGLSDQIREDSLTDGVVISYDAFGSNRYGGNYNLRTSYNMGRTTTHEVGHYLGLRHIWGDDSRCEVDDYVSDTPEVDSDHTGCPVNSFSCGTKDMFQNYMDYTDDVCMNLFTLGQLDRVMVVMENAIRRNTLLTSPGGIPIVQNNLDLAARSIQKPRIISCLSEIVPIIEIANYGSDTANGFEIGVRQNNGSEVRIEFHTSKILPGEIKTLTLSQMDFNEGNQSLAIKIYPYLQVDEDTLNNTTTNDFIVNDSREYSPYRESFFLNSFDESTWTVVNPDGGITWQIENTSGIGAVNKSAVIDFYNYSNFNQKDYLVSPVMDLSSSSEASVSFKTSYAYNPGGNDQLSLLAIDDCGEVFKTFLWLRAGANLAQNGQESTSKWEPSKPEDWQMHVVDLSNLAGNSFARIAFESTNKFGNTLYLDDVEFYLQHPDDIVTTDRNSIKINPNPSRNKQFSLQINSLYRQTIRVQIISLDGKTIYQKDLPDMLNQNVAFDLSGARGGVYIVRTMGKAFFHQQKLVLD